MDENERKSLQTAIEVMVLFGIRLWSSGDNQGNNSEKIASFSPDLPSLVCFGDGGPNSSRQQMMHKTQTLIHQNYEIIKQGMLSSGSSGIDAFA